MRLLQRNRRCEERLTMATIIRCDRCHEDIKDDSPKFASLADSRHGANARGFDLCEHCFNAVERLIAVPPPQAVWKGTK